MIGSVPFDVLWTRGGRQTQVRLGEQVPPVLSPSCLLGPRGPFGYG